MKSNRQGTATHREGALRGVILDIHSVAIRKAVDEALDRLPLEASDIPTLHTITSKRTSASGSLAGLTRRITYDRTLRILPSKIVEDEVVVQKIELYRDMMLQLSERSRVAVVAHELAHAWLNDNMGPEDSAKREEESDGLARKWGFAEELGALEDETY
jgi:hypothetical protein